MLGEQTEPISGTDHDEFPSLSIADIESGQNKDELTIQQILKNNADRIIDSYNDQKLQVERDDIWRSCLAFYKIGLNDHSRLKTEFACGIHWELREWNRWCCTQV